MCFFTSQHMQAEDIARKYGRRTDRVDAARLMLADKEHEARLSADTGGRTAIYDYRLNEGMYVSPAYRTLHGDSKRKRPASGHALGTCSPFRHPYRERAV